MLFLEIKSSRAYYIFFYILYYKIIKDYSNVNSTSVGNITLYFVHNVSEYF